MFLSLMRDRGMDWKCGQGMECVCVKDGGVLAGFGCPRHQVAATYCNTHATHCITLQLTHQEQDAHACSHSKHHPSKTFKLLTLAHDQTTKIHEIACRRADSREHAHNTDCFWFGCVLKVVQHVLSAYCLNHLMLQLDLSRRSL